VLPVTEVPKHLLLTEQYPRQSTDSTTIPKRWWSLGRGRSALEEREEYGSTPVGVDGLVGGIEGAEGVTLRALGIGHSSSAVADM